MLNYRKKVVLRETGENLIIETDAGATWHTSPVFGSNVITSWWKEQNQSELRMKQKEFGIQFPSMCTGKIIPYLIWKKGMGFKQPHDMSLCYSISSKLYFFSTLNDFWIYPKNPSGITVLEKSASLGSLDIKDNEDEIYDIMFSVLRPKFNPENIYLT